MALRLRPGVSRVTTEYGSVLLDEVDGRYWEANATAAMVLDAIEDSGEIESAVSVIVKTFDTDAETARGDVRLVVEQLRRLGVVA
ncbi:lasso peptide biosynthesis PqqD family chaperone [Streptomyces sp. NPDC055189]